MTPISLEVEQPADGKVVLFVVLNEDHKYDLIPGFKERESYFYPDAYPMSTAGIVPVAWVELPQLPEGCLYAWEK